MFEFIKNCNKEGDQTFHIKILELCNYHDLNPEDFGAQKAFHSFSVTAPIFLALSSLKTYKTPLEKLHCLRKTLDEINDELIRSTKKRTSPLQKLSCTAIASDDLIAAVICALVTVKVPEFVSEVAYIQTFSRYLPCKNEFGYSLVTFEVAKEYIKNFSISDLRKKKGLSNEITTPSSSFRENTLSGKTKTPFDLELEKLNKMMESSKVEPTSPKQTESNSSDLG